MKKYLFFAFLVGALAYAGCKSKTGGTKSAVSTEEGVLHKRGTMSLGGKIGWKAANDRYSADGTFKKWHFTELKMKEGQPETMTASLSIDLTSIWEKSPQLTDHLKAPDFFNIEKYTTATLDISNVRLKEGDTYTADMILNMKGIKQELTSDFVFKSMSPMRVAGTAKVDRTLFGLGGAGLGTGDLIEVSYDTMLPQ